MEPEYFRVLSVAKLPVRTLAPLRRRAGGQPRLEQVGRDAVPLASGERVLFLVRAPHFRRLALRHDAAHSLEALAQLKAGVLAEPSFRRVWMRL